MPRPGGPADKLGKCHEAVWTVHRLLDVAIGDAGALTPEPLIDGRGVECHLEREGISVRYLNRLNAMERDPVRMVRATSIEKLPAGSQAARQPRHYLKIRHDAERGIERYLKAWQE